MKTALITGASSELGESLIKNLKNKYNLILLYNSHKLDTFKEYENYKCDLNNEEGLNKTINQIKEKHNKINLIINLAANSRDFPAEEITSKEFLKTLNINVVSPFILIQQLLEQNGIAINISSTDGIDTFNEYNLTYATSKSALLHETKQLALIYPHAHIYALALNYINTKTTNNMNQEFLKQEMQRINQTKLIEINNIVNKIDELIVTLPKSGTIIRMD